MSESPESVLEALATIRQRLHSPRIVLPPTAKLEIMQIASQCDTAKERNLALSGIAAARPSRVVSVNLMPAGRGIVERVAERLRSAELTQCSKSWSVAGGGTRIRADAATAIPASWRRRPRCAGERLSR